MDSTEKKYPLPWTGTAVRKLGDPLTVSLSAPQLYALYRSGRQTFAECQADPRFSPERLPRMFANNGHPYSDEHPIAISVQRRHEAALVGYLGLYAVAHYTLTWSWLRVVQAIPWQRLMPSIPAFPVAAAIALVAAHGVLPTTTLKDALAVAEPMDTSRLLMQMIRDGHLVQADSETLMVSAALRQWKTS